MNALGNYLLSGKFKSVAMIGLLTILSLVFPPLSYILSGTPFGLVTLRKGAVYGLQILAGTLLLTTIFGYFSKLGFGLGAAFATSVWLPVWTTSVVLRMTESHGLAVLVAGGFGLVFIAFLSLFNEELSLWWQSWITSILENSPSGTATVQMQELFESILPYLGGILASGLVISLIATVLLARYWQSSLFNPGGFRQEFHRLMLPRWVTITTIVCLIMSIPNLVEYYWVARNFLAILIVLHVFQGIAAVHRVVYDRKFSRNWLILMYSFLFVMPQLALFLACIGMVYILNRGKKTTPNSTE